MTVRHAPTVLAALALMASTLSWTAGSWVQARCIAWSGPRRLVRPGQCLVAVGLGVMCAALLPRVPPALAVMAWAIAGAGIGTAYAPLSVTTLDRAAAGEEGRATSALQLCDVLGQALGAGVAGAIVAVAAAGRGHGPAVALTFFAYGVVRQLFERRLAAAGEGERAALLAGPAAAVRPLLAGEVFAQPAGDSAFAVLHGLYWLVVNLAAGEPLLIAVDDAHWADEPSLRWLAYLAPRLEGLTAGMLVAMRQEGTFTGTHHGTLHSPAGDIAPTDRPVAVDYIHVLRYRDGKRTSFNLLFDRLQMLAQLGLIPAPAPAG